MRHCHSRDFSLKPNSVSKSGINFFNANDVTSPETEANYFLYDKDPTSTLDEKIENELSEEINVRLGAEISAFPKLTAQIEMKNPNF